MVDWLLHHGTRIAFVIALAGVAYWLARRWVPRAVRLSVSAEEGGLEERLRLAEQQKRIETLSRVLVRTIAVVLTVVTALVVAGEAGLPLAPLIAGAGIAGIAIGFGAQTLVRDLLSGLFILVESQYAVGDVVRVAGISGVVEDLNLRRTILRDLDGIVHSIPNGEIRVASNMTSGWSRVNLNVSVSYDDDLAHVRRVIDRVGAELAAEKEWAPLILEPPAVLRVDAFEDSGIAIKVLATTKAMEQWKVAGELRERLKAAFDQEGISIPFPHRVVIVRGEQPGPGSVSSDR